MKLNTKKTKSSHGGRLHRDGRTAAKSEDDEENGREGMMEALHVVACKKPSVEGATVVGGRLKGHQNEEWRKAQFLHPKTLLLAGTGPEEKAKGAKVSERRQNTTALPERASIIIISTKSIVIAADVKQTKIKYSFF